MPARDARRTGGQAPWAAVMTAAWPALVVANAALRTSCVTAGYSMMICRPRGRPSAVPRCRSMRQSVPAPPLGSHRDQHADSRARQRLLRAATQSPPAPPRCLAAHASTSQKSLLSSSRVHAKLEQSALLTSKKRAKTTVNDVFFSKRGFISPKNTIFAR